MMTAEDGVRYCKVPEQRREENKSMGEGVAQTWIFDFVWRDTCVNDVHGNCLREVGLTGFRIINGGELLEGAYCVGG